MIKMNKKYKTTLYIVSLKARSIALAALLTAVSALPLCAQLHESVNVEGTYLRDILHPDRINQLPKLSNFRISDSVLHYALQGVPAEFDPQSPPLSATAWGAERNADKRIGYLDFAAGSYLNMSLDFGVGIIRQQDQRLDLRLNHYSTTLWKPFGELTDPRQSYDENIGLRYTKIFKGIGTLSVSGQYHLGFFNYYGVDPTILHTQRDAEPYHFATQTLNDAAFKAEWNSSRGISTPIDWHASAGARYFGTRTATRETDISLAGGVAKNFGDAHRAGIDAHLNSLIYSEGSQGTAPDNYTALELNPFYRWRSGKVQFRIGADLDMTFNADGKTADTHFGAVHIAPDIRFDVASRNAGFFIRVTGGTELHTLAAMWQLDPYRNPHLESTMPVYTPVDAVIGTDFTPFQGFTAGISLRYKVTSNVPMDGWYMAMLNYGVNPIPGLEIPAGLQPMYGQGFERYNLSGFGAEVKLNYKPSDIFEIHANGFYTPQNNRTGIFNGLDRPRWLADAGFEVAPLKSFRFGADFEYRGVRRIYTGYYNPDESNLTPGGSRPEPDSSVKMKVASLRLPDICRLSAHITWSLSSNFSLRVDADNLLCRRFTLLPMMPTERLTLMGRMQWLF